MVPKLLRIQPFFYNNIWYEWNSYETNHTNFIVQDLKSNWKGLFEQLANADSWAIQILEILEHNKNEKNILVVIKKVQV